MFFITLTSLWVVGGSGSGAMFPSAVLLMFSAEVPPSIHRYLLFLCTSVVSGGTICSSLL
jgi:hypothetical protein